MPLALLRTSGKAILPVPAVRTFTVHTMHSNLPHFPYRGVASCHFGMLVITPLAYYGIITYEGGVEAMCVSQLFMNIRDSYSVPTAKSKSNRRVNVLS